MATTQALLTAEEFLLLPESGEPLELVRGVPLRVHAVGGTYIPVCGGLHGLVCNRLGRFLGNFVEERGLGVVLNAGFGVVTEHHPDSVRQADLAYYSAQRLPRGSLTTGLVGIAPDLICEVRSPSDTWLRLTAVAAECLLAGVLVVCVLDPDARTATVYRCDRPAETLAAGATLAFPELLPGWEVALERLFD